MATVPQPSAANSTAALAQSLSNLLNQISAVNQSVPQPVPAALYSTMNQPALQQMQSNLPAISAEGKTQDLDWRTSQVTGASILLFKIFTAFSWLPRFFQFSHLGSIQHIVLLVCY